jgi:hypothetical protein
MSRLHFESLTMKQQGKPDAGNPHVRFDEGEASRPFRAGTSLLYLILSTIPEGRFYRMHRIFRISKLEVLPELSCIQRGSGKSRPSEAGSTGCAKTPALAVRRRSFCLKHHCNLD